MSARTLEVKGLKNLYAGLDALGPAHTTSIMRSSVRLAFKPMVEAAKRLVPLSSADENDDGYHLREAIGLKLVPKSRRLRRRGVRSSVHYFLGPHRETDAEGNIRGGLSEHPRAPNYAAIQEERSPYLRPALDATVRTCLDLFATSLRRKMISRMKREAKKGLVTDPESIRLLNALKRYQ